MKKLSAVFLCGVLFAAAGAAPVPSSARLTISLKYKDNYNLLRLKSTGYAVQKDGYAATIWIEGPYSPSVPCQITSLQRQNIRMVKVITFMAYGQTRLQDGIVPNSWMYVDYDTPDFTAALITNGMHYHCTYLTAEHDRCSTSVLSPVNSLRKDPATGKVPCGPASVLRSDAFPWCPNIADITAIPDGVTGATVYPDSQVTYTWDMRDTAGNLIQEGHYLVYAMFSAERLPRVMEGDTIVRGVAVVNLETCWDNPYFDTLGHHRIVNLFHFKDSAFTKADSNERYWKGDPYRYLNGPVVFTYDTSGPAVEEEMARRAGTGLEALPNPFSRSVLIRPAGAPASGCLSVFNLRGERVKELFYAPGHAAVWDGRDFAGRRASAGLYFIRLKTTAGETVRRVVLK